MALTQIISRTLIRTAGVAVQVVSCIDAPQTSTRAKNASQARSRLQLAANCARWPTCSLPMQTLMTVGMAMGLGLIH